MSPKTIRPEEIERHLPEVDANKALEGHHKVERANLKVPQDVGKADASLVAAREDRRVRKVDDLEARSEVRVMELAIRQERVQVCRLACAQNHQQNGNKQK